MSQLAQKATMLRRWAKILAGGTEVAVEQGPGRCCRSGELAGYWNDLTGKVSPNTLLDDCGVPLSVIAGGRKVNFPIAVFQYALGRYDLSLIEPNNAEEHLDALRACADWALASQRADGSWDAFGPIGSSKYTVSSMAQGEGCSMLLRAYRALSDDRYLEAALEAARFMLVDFADGGTAIRENDGLFLEEYPQDPRRSVMNGWVFSLFGLYDASLADDSFCEPFALSCQTLASHLDDYDSGYWSLYDLERRISSPAYHTLHIAQLRAVAELTGDDRFSDKAERFEGYAAKRANRIRAIAGKVAQKLAEKSDAVIVQ
ncbi:D-glucuronyl C5-epimerase family protein [Candidatus Collinsella stercoripullorum]|uniref:D-glucuronyl C5-epimerase family protein n=1 Tax=Candidatus Collinsella stercoripullorum TaxID=2838522 RepID=UPI0022E49DE3|nr:D-glucuronyl C5-epimerase family protein [Candidatus Collinsella stercoripullorum]